MVAVITIVAIIIVAVMIAITIRMVVVGGNTMDNSFLYMKTLLLVDDELDLLKMLFKRRWFSKNSYGCYGERSGCRGKKRKTGSDHFGCDAAR